MSCGGISLTAGTRKHRLSYATSFTYYPTYFPHCWSNRVPRLTSNGDAGYDALDRTAEHAV